jgi:hypothetical protein
MKKLILTIMLSVLVATPVMAQKKPNMRQKKVVMPPIQGEITKGEKNLAQHKNLEFPNREKELTGEDK